MTHSLTSFKVLASIVDDRNHVVSRRAPVRLEHASQFRGYNKISIRSSTKSFTE